MENQDVKRTLENLDLPWGKKVVVQELEYETGLRMLRLRFREGTRFTLIDLDAPSVQQLAETMLSWSKENMESDASSV
jgi:hypothetical protein